jgi:hypothetical protein
VPALIRSAVGSAIYLTRSLVGLLSVVDREDQADHHADKILKSLPIFLLNNQSLVRRFQLTYVQLLRAATAMAQEPEQAHNQ